MPLPQAGFLMTLIVLTGASFILFVCSLEIEGGLSVESRWTYRKNKIRFRHARMATERRRDC